MVSKAERGSTEAVLNLVDYYNEKVDSDEIYEVCEDIIEDVVSKLLEEEVKSKLEEVVNGPFQGGKGTEVLVGVDAVGLYPSISKEIAMRAYLGAARESSVRATNMNLMEATRLLIWTRSIRQKAV